MKKNKKKRVFIIVGVLLVILVAAAVGVFAVLPKPVQANMQGIDVGRIPNGVYEGSYENGLVAARVAVEVKDGKIVQVSILEHRNGMGQAGEEVVQQVIDSQTTDVDLVAGATYSSQTILKAVEDALRQGMEQAE